MQKCTKGIRFSKFTWQIVSFQFFDSSISQLFLSCYLSCFICFYPFYLFYLLLICSYLFYFVLSGFICFHMISYIFMCFIGFYLCLPVFICYYLFLSVFICFTRFICFICFLSILDWIGWTGSYLEVCPIRAPSGAKEYHLSAILIEEGSWKLKSGLRRLFHF